MKYIRVRVKTLITLTILLVGIILFSKDMYWFGVKTLNKVLPAEHKIEMSMLPENSMKDEMARLEILLTENNYNLYQLARIGDGMMMGSSRIKSHDALKTYEQFRQNNLERDLFVSEADYVLNVILIQWFGGNVKEAKTLLAEMNLEVLSEKQLSEFYIIKSTMELSEFNLEALEISLSKITYDDYKDIPLGIKSFVDIYLRGNKELEAHQVKYSEVEKSKYLSYFDEIFSNLRSANSTYRDNTETRTLDNKISGYVLLNGQPVEGAILYTKYSSGMSSVEGFDNEFYITDEKGYYEFNNTPINLRSVNLAVVWQGFHDKQIKSYRDMDWTAESDMKHNFEFYDGISFKEIAVNDGYLEYEIEDPLANENRSYYFSAIPVTESVNSSFTSIGMTIDYSDIEGRIAIDTLRKYSNLPFNYSSSQDALAVERFMEPLYLSDNYIFRISPKDLERDSYSWNGLSSDALSSTVWVDAVTEYNQGDKLLESKEFDAAKEWYAMNPSLHNLRVLIALYTRGTIVTQGEYEEILSGAEPEKAIPYLEQLIERYGSTEMWRSDLADLYKDLGDYEMEEHVLLDNLRYDPSPYDYIMLAYNNFNQGRYDEAIEILLANSDMAIDGDRYYAYFIIGDITEPLPEKMSLLLETLDGKENFSSFYTLIKNGKTVEAYEWLLNTEESDLREFYMINILDAFGRSSWNVEGHSILKFDEFKRTKAIDETVDFYEYYIETYERTDDKSIRDLYTLLNPTWID